MGIKDENVFLPGTLWISQDGTTSCKIVNVALGDDNTISVWYIYTYEGNQDDIPLEIEITLFLELFEIRPEQSARIVNPMKSLEPNKRTAYGKFI